MFLKITGSPEKTNELWKVRKRLVFILKDYPAHKLILLSLRCLIDFSMQHEDFFSKLEAHSQILISTLDIHLKTMVERLEMSEVVDIFLELHRPVFKFCLDKRSWNFE